MGAMEGGWEMGARQYKNKKKKKRNTFVLDTSLAFLNIIYPLLKALLPLHPKKLL